MSWLTSLLPYHLIGVEGAYTSVFTTSSSFLWCRIDYSATLPPELSAWLSSMGWLKTGLIVMLASSSCLSARPVHSTTVSSTWRTSPENSSGTYHRPRSWWGWNATRRVVSLEQLLGDEVLDSVPRWSGLVLHKIFQMEAKLKGHRERYSTVHHARKDMHYTTRTLFWFSQL